MKRITILVPVYNEAGVLEQTVRTVLSCLERPDMEFRLLFVDDGSGDETPEILDKFSRENGAVSFISLSRNFGKEAAIFAGLEHCTGDAAIVMDGDLQHPPEIIREMIALWEEGFEVIDAVKEHRGNESVFYKGASAIFNFLMSRLTGFQMKNSSDFKLLDAKAVDALLGCREKTRFFRGLTEWIGFRHTSIRFHVQERPAGRRSWSFASLIRYSIRNVLSFSSLPIHLITFLGFITVIIAVILSVQTLYMKLSGNAVEGFTTVILAVTFFSGILLLSLGVLGEYMAKIYEELKNRPIYIRKDGPETKL